MTDATSINSDKFVYNDDNPDDDSDAFEDSKEVLSEEMNHRSGVDAEVDRCVKVSLDIAFARGGAHLPIAHALRLLSTQELRSGLTKIEKK